MCSRGILKLLPKLDHLMPYLYGAWGILKLLPKLDHLMPYLYGAWGI